MATVKIMQRINRELINRLISTAKNSPRKRTIHRFHKKDNDLLQRMLNVMEPDTYVTPHKHEKPDKREVFILLSGKALFLEFDDDGNITDKEFLSPADGCFGAEVQPGIYHTIIALESGTVCYELKDGPYKPDEDKCFAPWAPAEGEDGTKEYLRKLLASIIVPNR